MRNEQEIAERYNEYTKRNRERFITAPLRTAQRWVKILIEFLDNHSGLLTALATVAIAWLTISMSRDSSRQAETAAGLLSTTQSQQQVMQGQLDEMRKQREFTIAQLRASLKREPIRYQRIDQFGNVVTGNAQFAGWSFNSIWSNVGSTSARNVESWSTFYPQRPAKIKDGRVVWECPNNIPNVTINKQFSTVVDKGGVLTEIAIDVPAVAIDHAAGPNPDAVLYLAGHMQYNDIFPDTPLHYLDWCVAAVPSNNITGNFSFHIMYEREN